MTGESKIETMADVEIDDEIKDNTNKMFNKDYFIKSMHQIFVDRVMSKLEYSQLYQLVYEYCVKGQDLHIWYGLYQTENETSSGISRTEEMSMIINDFLSKHIKEHVSEGTYESDEDGLLYYSKAWNDYRWSTTVLNNVLMYLNRQKAKRTEDRTTVEKMAYQIWREHVYDHLNEKVSKAALEMIERNRNGEIINTTAIKNVIQSYIELGSLETKQDSNNCAKSDADDLQIYKLFEAKVLSATSEYYRKDGESAMEKYYVEGKSFVEYMKFIQARLYDEIKRTKMLHPTSETPLMKLCYDILIGKPLEIFDAEFQTYLKSDRLDEMELMCSLAVRSDAVVKRLNAIFGEYVLKEGQNEMEKCVNEAFKDPRKYIQIILSVHSKYTKIVCQRFKNEIGFKGALDKACSTFVNKNAVTGKAKNQNFSAESLASYCHLLLKKSNKSMEDAELETALEEIMIIFRYIEDKDVFEGFYKRRLADRLVLDLSASDDAEALLISKMKQACGYEYTNKLQVMYQDIAVSKNLADKFRQKIETSGVPLNADFRIKCLTNGSWPLTNDIAVNLPIELTSIIDRFYAFYVHEHTGRKLVWLHKLSKAELVMSGKKQRYYIKANTLQTAVLLLFNDQLSYTVQHLVDYTGTEKSYVMLIIESMIKMKLLKKKSDESQKSLSETTQVELNTEYNEPKIRFDITGKLESERRAEQKQTLHRIDEDRGHLIEAAIVRIMKMRKKLSNRDLIGEVLTQLAGKFIPKIPHIKKSIEKLIDKEYLERASEIDTYHYLA